MSQWPTVALGEVCEERPGTRNPKDDPDTPFLYVDISSVDSEAKAITEPKKLLGGEAPSRARRIIRAGDVIVSMTRPNLNAVGLVPPDLDDQVCSTGFSVLRPNGNALSEYIFHFTRSKRFVETLSGAVSGAMYPAVTEGQVKAVTLPLPPLSEQRRIVDILNRANGIRRLRREAQEKARLVIPALFVEMFGDPQRNPKGWPTHTLGELLGSIDSGWSPKCHDREPEGDEWGVLKLSAITSGHYAGWRSKALPLEFSPRPQLEVGVGDVLFSRKNTRALIAACALVEDTKPRLMLPDLIFRLVPRDTQILTSHFLWAVLTHSGKRRQVQALASGSAGSMPNISKGRLRLATIPVPPLDLQQTFASRVTDIQAMIGQQDRMTAASERLVQSLMGEVFG